MAYELKEAVIEVTRQCNLTCLHCGSGCLNKKPDNELSISGWKKCIKELGGLGVEKVVFSGGEPILKTGFDELASYTANLGIKFGFLTNGFLSNIQNRRIFKKILKYKPFAIGVSLDGLKNVHNQIRRNEQSWQMAGRTISDIFNAGIKVCIITTINRLNIKELPILAKWISLIEPDTWQLQLAMPTGRMKKNRNLLIDEKEFKSVCGQIVYFRKNYPEVNLEAADCFGLAPPGTIRKSEWPGCGAGRYALGIDAQGYILPCLSMQFDNKKERFGEKTIRSIWKSSPIFSFNRNFDPQNAGKKCLDCKYLLYCRGGCASQSFAYYGHFHESPFCFYRNFKEDYNEKCN